MSIHRAALARSFVAPLVLMWTLFARGPLAFGQTVADAPNAEAKKYFDTGVAYLDDPDGERFEEAYRAFKRAYELSKSPKVLGNIGLCAMKLERDGEAIDAYSRYLKISDIDPDERAQIERDLRSLETSAVKVTITVDRPNTLLVDSHVTVRGGTVTNAYGPVTGSITLRIREGHHVVRAKTGGEQHGVWEFDAPPGGTLAHHFRVEPPRPPPVVHGEPSSPPVAAWVLTGVGSAALAAGAATAVATSKTVSQLERDCPNDICPSGYDLNGKRDSARTLATTTNALFLGGGLLAAAGVSWLVLNEIGSAPSNRDRGARGEPVVSAGAACLPGACSLSFRLRL